jgi:hypothetical protein
MSNKNYFKYLIIIILFIGLLNSSTCVIKKMTTGIEVFEYWDDENNKLDIEAKLSYINFDTGQRTSLAGRNLIFNVTVFKNDDSNETITRTIQTDSMGWGRRTFYLDDVKEYQVLVEYEGESNFKPSTGTVGGGGDFDEKKYITNLPEGISLVSCLPILILFGFLGAAMYASGGNPFGFVDLTTTRGFRMNRNLRKMMMLQSAGSVGAQMLGSVIGGLGALRKALTKLEGAKSEGGENTKGKEDNKPSATEEQGDGKVNTVMKNDRRVSRDTKTPGNTSKGPGTEVKMSDVNQKPSITKGTPKTYEGLRKVIDVLSVISSLLTFNVIGGIQGIGAASQSGEEIMKNKFFYSREGRVSEQNVQNKIKKLREMEKIQSMTPDELKEHLRLIKMNAKLEKETNEKTIETIDKKIEKLKKAKENEKKGINKIKMRWQINRLKSKKEILNRKNEIIDKKDLDLTKIANKIDDLYEKIGKTGDFNVYDIDIKNNNLIYLKNFSEILDKEMDVKIDINTFKNEIKKMEEYSNEITERTLEVNSNIETNILRINSEDIERIKNEIENKNKEEDYDTFSKKYVKENYDNIIDKMIDNQEYGGLKNLGVDEILISDYVIEKKYDLADEFREAYSKINPQNREVFATYEDEELEKIKDEIMYKTPDLLEGYGLSKKDRTELNKEEIKKVKEYEDFIEKNKMPVDKAEEMFSKFDNIYKIKETTISNMKQKMGEIDKKIEELYGGDFKEANKKMGKKIEEERKKVEEEMDKIKRIKTYESQIMEEYQTKKLEKPDEYTENMMKLNYLYNKNKEKDLKNTLDKIKKNERIYEPTLDKLKNEIESDLYLRKKREKKNN